MDHQSDVLFAIDVCNHQPDSRYDSAITQADQLVDNVIEYKQTIAAIEIHLVIMLLPLATDPIGRQNRADPTQCKLI